MPKRTKPRKPNASRTAASLANTASPGAARRRRFAKFASILVVIALVATVLIGAIISTPAKATELNVAGNQAPITSVSAASAEPDTDGDGIPNNADADIDGDGIVNGVDPDIDGDGTPNAKDADPAGTNGPAPSKTQNPTVKLPEILPEQFNSPGGRILVAGALLAIGVGVIAARRRRK